MDPLSAGAARVLLEALAHGARADYEQWPELMLHRTRSGLVDLVEIIDKELDRREGPSKIR
jgi:hypothetical protein